MTVLRTWGGRWRTQLGLLSIISTELNPEPVPPLKVVENQETLRISALVSQLQNPPELRARVSLPTVEHAQTGSIFLASMELLRVEELAVATSEIFTDGHGSRPTDTALGRCLPAPVSQKV